MLAGIKRKKHSEEVAIAVGVVALFVVMFSAALYFKPAIIPQTLRFGIGNGANGNNQVLKLPTMAVNLRDERELILAVNIEVPDTGSRETLDGNKAKLKIAVREIVAGHSSGELFDGKGRQRLKNAIVYATAEMLPPGTPINVYISDFHVN